MKFEMLAVLAFSMVIAFMALIMTKRMSALIALIVVPVVFAAIGGFAADLGPMMLDGIKALAPTAVMLMFAILYFGVMIDAGLFDPVVNRIVKVVDGDPLKIVVGTAILALFVSLDGDGSTTYIITTAAMLPLYKRLRMSNLVLASVIMQASGVANLLPWGGPTARVASALKVEVSDVFNPMIPAMVASALWVIFVAYLFGLRERRRLGVPGESALSDIQATTSDEKESEVDESGIRRPKLFYINLALTVALMAALMLAVLPLPALFMIAFAVAMTINYPRVQHQKERIRAHSGNVLAVVSLIFAAGIFTGILSGTKMADAMARSVIAVTPDSLGPYLAPITGLLSIPFTFILSNDAFYYGVLPILAEAGEQYGITPAQIGRAALIGQPVHLLSPLVASTYLLVGLVKVELGDHQRFTLIWSVLSSLVLLAVGLATTAIPLVGVAR
jgi:citrate-Mg2+:H+ or citrate-Ca2+:H+ symporter, CitMHS family